MSRTFRYRVFSTTQDDLGTLEHPAPNLEPGDVIMLPDIGRRWSPPWCLRGIVP
jgi:hypothetical protein